MTLQDLVDRLNAIIAARDERIELLMEELRIETKMRRYIAFVLAGDENADAQIAADDAHERIDLLATELRRRIIADRDSEIGIGKLEAGWAWAASTEKLITDKYKKQLQEYGL